MADIDNSVEDYLRKTSMENMESTGENPKIGENKDMIGNIPFEDIECVAKILGSRYGFVVPNGLKSRMGRIRLSLDKNFTMKDHTKSIEDIFGCPSQVAFIFSDFMIHYRERLESKRPGSRVVGSLRYRPKDFDSWLPWQKLLYMSEARASEKWPEFFGNSLQQKESFSNKVKKYLLSDQAMDVFGEFCKLGGEEVGILRETILESELVTPGNAGNKSENERRLVDRMVSKIPPGDFRKNLRVATKLKWVCLAVADFIANLSVRKSRGKDESEALRMSMEASSKRLEDLY